MRIELTCRCGARGRWEGSSDTPVSIAAEKWQERHQVCPFATAAREDDDDLLRYLGGGSVPLAPKEARDGTA